MSALIRVFLWCPLWRVAFVLTAPIDHIAKCRMADALGYRVTWKHIFNMCPVSSESMSVVGGPHA